MFRREPRAFAKPLAVFIVAVVIVFVDVVDNRIGKRAQICAQLRANQPSGVLHFHTPCFGFGGVFGFLCPSLFPLLDQAQQVGDADGLSIFTIDAIPVVEIQRRFVQIPCERAASIGMVAFQTMKTDRQARGLLDHADAAIFFDFRMRAPVAHKLHGRAVPFAGLDRILNVFVHAAISWGEIQAPTLCGKMRT